MTESRLDSLIHFWSLLAEFGFVLVIGGVVLEGAELFQKWGRKRKVRVWIGEVFERKRRRSVVQFLKWLQPRLLPVESLGFAILVLGLALEFVADGAANRYQEEKIGRLKQQAGLAIERAEKLANETEQLSRSNLKLFEQVQPRRVSQKQREKIKKELSPWLVKEKCSVAIQYEFCDSEAAVFAGQIGSVLRECGFVVSEFPVQTIPQSGKHSHSVSFGVAFGIKTDPQPQSALHIIAALSGAGVVDPPSGVFGGGLFLEENTLKIDIGAKPNSPP